MGKARTFSDVSNDVVYQAETNNENYVLSSQNNTQGLGGGVFNDQSGYANISQAGTDQRKANLKGVLFTGNIGFDLQTAVLDVGTDTIDLLEDASSTALSLVSTDRFVTLSSGSTADLVTILGVQRPGQRLRLYNTLTNTITIKHTASAIDNTIRTPNAADLIFPGNAVIDLTFDITAAQWRVVGNVGGSGGGISFPIDFPEIDLGNVSGTVDINWALSTRHAIRFTMVGDTTLTFSNTTPNTTEYSNLIAVQDSIGGRTLTLPAGTINAATVESGILVNPDNETGIVIKFSFGIFFAFLETGNIVSGGGGGLNTDLSNMTSPTIPPVNLSMNSNDIDEVDRLLFTQDSGAASGVNNPQIYVDGIGAGDLVINNIDTEAIIFTHSNVIGLQETPTVLQKSGVDSNQFIRLVNTFATPAIGALGAFEISGVNDTPAQLTMAFFAGSVVQITSNGSGSAQLGVAIDGIQTDFIRINDIDDGQTSFLSDIDLNANAVILDADGDSKIQTGTDDVMQFTTGGTVQLSLGNASTVITQNTIFGGNADINGNELILDADGDTQINSVGDDVIQFITGGGLRANLTTTALNMAVPIVMFTNKITSLGDPTAAQDAATKNYVDTTTVTNPLTVDLDFDGNDILNLDDIQFNIAGQSITTDGAGMLFTVPTADTFEFSISGSGIRLTLAQDITLDCESGDDILFKEAGITVGEYSGGANGWLFDPTGSFTIDVGNDITLEAADDITINAGTDILFRDNGVQVLTYTGATNDWVLQNANFQINTGTFINFITSVTSATAGAQTLPSNPVGFIRVEVAGTERAIPFYAI